MKNNNLLIGIYQVFASLLMAIITLYLTFSFLYRYLYRKHGIPLSNLACAILTASILFAVSYLISGTIQPVITTIKVIKTNVKDSNLWKDSLTYTALFMFIGIITASVINSLAIFLFTKLTRNINELEELKKDNYAIGVIIGMIIISISLVVKDSMVYIIESFIPYPEIPGLY